MIHYIAVTGLPEAVARVSPELAAAIEVSRCFDGDLRTACSPRGSWALAAISTPDLLAGNRLGVSGDSFAIVNGPALAIGLDPKDLGHSLRSLYSASGAGSVDRALRGSYNFVGYSPERGLSAFVDFSGQTPLYWDHQDGVTLFGNRSSAVRYVGGPGGWDLRALSWLTGPSLRGDRLPAASARYLRPGTVATVAPDDARVTICDSPNWIWPVPGDDELRDDLTSDEWDEVTQDLTANFAALGSIQQRLRLRLSGGKDSRLAVALAAAAGIADELLAVTTGPEDSPEVECAAAVARIAGIEHTRASGPRAAAPNPHEAPAFDWPAVWRRIRQHSYRYEGTVSPWDGTNDRLGHTTVNLTGFGGEFYKRGGTVTLIPGDTDDTESVVRALSRGVDPGCFRRPAIVEYQDELIDDWTRSNASSVRLHALPEKWYVDYRLGHWNGPMAQGKAVHISVAPLLSPVAARSALGLSLHARTIHRFHFEVTRRAAPRMLEIPLLDDVWAPELRSESTLAVPGHGFPTTHGATPQRLFPWQFAFVEQQRPAIEALFDEAFAETDIGLIIDRHAVLDALGKGPASPRQVVRQVISTVGIATTLLGQGEPVVDHCGWTPNARNNRVRDQPST